MGRLCEPQNQNLKFLSENLNFLRSPRKPSAHLLTDLGLSVHACRKEQCLCRCDSDGVFISLRDEERWGLIEEPSRDRRGSEMVARRNPIARHNTVLNGIQMVGRLYLCSGFEAKITMVRITPIDVIKGISSLTPVTSQICCNSMFVNQ